MAEPDRRRRRPAISCALCRRRKIRCNRETPCNNCVRFGKDDCTYESHATQSLPQKPGHGQPRASLAHRAPSKSADSAPSLSGNSTISSRAFMSSVTSPMSSNLAFTGQPSAQYIESMQIKIRQLEEQLAMTATTSTPENGTGSLSKAATVSALENSTILSPRTVENSHFHYDFSQSSRLFGHCQVMSRSVMHKSRLYGQSHWVNGLARVSRDVLLMMEPHVQLGTSKAFTGMQKCKSLGRMIKWQRTPSWPTPPRPDLPLKDLCDKLVDCYIQTFETVYRILHVPTFRRDYEAMWVSEGGQDRGFLVQLKLVFALGATMYDDQFSLRTSALQWVYEAQNWVAEPEFKSHLSLQFLQTYLLLLLARSTVGVGEDFTWISAGALLRLAVYMGLHKDPANLPKRTTFAAEMRRRLWNSILEINLQSSIYCGGAPFISLADFDTMAPANLEDEQLTAENPVPRPDHEFTQVSIAIALRKTFPLRLAITKSLNDLESQGTYEEALRLDAEFRASYKDLCRTLQACNPTAEHSPSRFAIDVVDFIMRRYLSALHIPFYGPEFQDTAYAFSRKVVIETSLKLFNAVFPHSSMMGPHTLNDAAPPEREYLRRLAMCGSGFFRLVAFQASFLILGELIAQLKEEEGLGPVSLRPDLLAVVSDSKTWSLQSIEAGETNMKGYLIICLITTQIEGLMQGLRREAFPASLVKAVEDGLERCLSILERILSQTQMESNSEISRDMFNSVLAEPIEEWDFIISDSQFNFGNTEPISWLFGDDDLQPGL